MKTYAFHYAGMKFKTNFLPSLFQLHNLLMVKHMTRTLRNTMITTKLLKQVPNCHLQ